MYYYTAKRTRLTTLH